MTDTQQPEALRCAENLDVLARCNAVEESREDATQQEKIVARMSGVYARDAATELRRQHRRIRELEAELKGAQADIAILEEQTEVYRQMAQEYECWINAFHAGCGDFGAWLAREIDQRAAIGTMKERPILFNGPMVRAILEGRKTQTRRTLKNQRAYDLDKCPYGKPGDRLWVRETWATDGHGNLGYRADALGGDTPRQTYEYSNGDEFDSDVWRPSIHMPRWASRITLEITGVRVERVQDISEEDALAEGIEKVGDFFNCPCWRDYSEPAGPDVPVFPDDPIGSFCSLWESTGGDWIGNLLVWVIEFKLRQTGVPAEIQPD